MNTPGHSARIVLAAVAAALLPLQGVAGQEDERNVRIGISFGGAFPLADVDVPTEIQDGVAEATFESELLVGLDVGYRLDEHWELEGSFLIVPNAEFTATGTSGVSLSSSDEVIYLAGDALYFFRRGNIQPFVMAGIGTRSDDLFGLFGGTDNLIFAGNLGGGVVVPASRVFSVRLSARHFIYSFDRLEEAFATGEASTQHDLMLSAGMAFHF